MFDVAPDILERYVTGLRSGKTANEHKKEYVAAVWNALGRASYPSSQFLLEHPTYNKLEGALPAHSRQFIRDRAPDANARIDSTLSLLVLTKRVVDRQIRAARSVVDDIRRIEAHVGNFRLEHDPADMGTIDLLLAFYWAQDAKGVMQNAKIEFVWKAFATTPMNSHAFFISNNFDDLFLNGATTFECFSRQAASSGRAEVSDWASQVAKGARLIDGKIAAYDQFIVKVISESQKKYPQLQKSLRPSIFKFLCTDMLLKEPTLHVQSGLVIDPVD